MEGNVQFFAGICRAVRSLQELEDTHRSRIHAYEHIAELLNAAESKCWSESHAWLSEGRIPTDGLPDTLGAWQRRATMCLLLADFIERGDFNG